MSSMKHYVQRVIYRLFRRLKNYYLTRPVRLDTRLFFFCVNIADKVMSPRARESQSVWKQLYFNRYGTHQLYKVDTNKAVASDSHDHQWPRGTIADNSTNPRFNLKLYDYFDNRNDLRVLDLGCSGGGFVRSFLEDGYLAIGLEGSDASKKLRSAEWDTCRHHLFTSDITAPFSISDVNGKAMTFLCITSWEVLEHISEDKLDVLLDNIKRHLAEDGIFVASIDMAPDGNPITGAVYHVTLQSKFWWLARFAKAGLMQVPRHHFDTRDYVRGHGMGLKDWDPADGDGFHVVLKKASCGDCMNQAYDKTDVGSFFEYKGYQIPIHLMKLTGGGSDTFDLIASAHIQIIRELVGIDPNWNFLEIGCGIGRDAIPLGEILKPNAKYVGIDIEAASIDWCNQNISKRHPNFKFHFIDIYEKWFNPNGKVQLSSVKLPVDNMSTDLVFLQSVFTHMLRTDIVHYLKDFERLLRRGGKVYATFFIVDDNIRSALNDKSYLQFKHTESPGCFIQSKDSPTQAVAYTEDVLQEMLDAAGLELAQPITYGCWSGMRSPTNGGQDSVVIRRRGE